MNAKHLLLLVASALLMILRAMSSAHFPRTPPRNIDYLSQHIHHRQHNRFATNDTAAVELVRYRRAVTTERAKQIAKHRMRKLQEMEQKLLVMLNVNSRWEQYILPGPMAMATLGQLVVSSSKRDFKLGNVNVGKTKYLRNTNFRPAIIQVVNESWIAFTLANRNMERIKLGMATLPRNVKQAVGFLGTLKPQIISKFLPVPLNATETTANKCVQYAAEIDAAFIKVVKLLAEVDDALGAASGYYREGLLKNKRDKAIAEQERTFLKTIYKEAKKEFAEVSRKLSVMNAQEINFKEILWILQEGISGITSLKRRFGRLIRFFQKISGITSVTLQKAAKGFLKDARQLGYSPEEVKDFLFHDPTFRVRDNLASGSSRIATVSNFLATLSDVYITVSNKHITHRLAAVLGLHTVKDSERLKKLQQLFAQSAASQDDIQKIASEKRQAFKRAFIRSKSEITELFKSLEKLSEHGNDSIDTGKIETTVSPYTESCLVGC